jgi:hypothetical protein
MEKNEQYVPENPLYYNYAIKNFLIKDSALFFDSKLYEKIMLCVYSINTTGKYPFIQYLLSNNGFDNMCLPNLPVFTSLGKDKLIDYSKVYLSGILQVENFEEFNKKIEYNGYYEFEQNIYLFFDVTNYDTNINLYPVIFALIDEIINHRKICSISISEEVNRFFIKNDSLNYLYDENNEAYETPIVGFVGKPTPQKINFTYIFGESPKNKSAILGSYYYFTNFNYAIRQGGWSHDYKPEIMYNKLITDSDYGRYSNGGIVRFALFTGNTKYIENMPNLPNDESDIKKQRLNDSSLCTNYELQTLRISDHDGIWSRTYDSAYLGKLELDDGSFVEDSPSIVLKEYNQQIPLSYHFIDKSSLGNKYDSNNHSYRIV